VRWGVAHILTALRMVDIRLADALVTCYNFRLPPRQVPPGMARIRTDSPRDADVGLPQISLINDVKPANHLE